MLGQNIAESIQKRNMRIAEIGVSFPAEWSYINTATQKYMNVSMTSENILET